MSFASALTNEVASAKSQAQADTTAQANVDPEASPQANGNPQAQDEPLHFACDYDRGAHPQALASLPDLARLCDDSTVIRLATDWSMTEDEVRRLIDLL